MADNIESKIVTFVSKIAFNDDENLGKFKDEKNSDYGEFKIWMKKLQEMKRL